MMGHLPLPSLKHSLESVKKTHQVADIGGSGRPPDFSPSADFTINRPDTSQTWYQQTWICH
jgi:hypothetical protein